MIIIHEGLHQEADYANKTISEVYGIKNEVLNIDLKYIFRKTSAFPGYFCYINQLNSFEKKSGKKILVLTARDIYGDDKNQEDNWVFGYCKNRLSLVSTARMKKNDSLPSTKLDIPPEKYFKRISTIAIHEIGHEAVKAEHFKPAFSVNAKTNYRFSLGLHCDNNKCVMYEIIDIKAPKPEEGYLLLGKEKRFDAGLDDLIDRMTPEWFCSKCKKSILLDESF